VCLSVCPRPYADYSKDPDVTWGSGRGCPLVVHYWADLKSVHGLRSYGNITRTRNVSECMLVTIAENGEDEENERKKRIKSIGRSKTKKKHAE